MSEQVSHIWDADKKQISRKQCSRRGDGCKDDPWRDEEVSRSERAAVNAVAHKPDQRYTIIMGMTTGHVEEG